jgi:hypothetical protein
MLKQTAVLTAGLLLFSSKAEACGGCALALFEYSMPHILPLCLGISVWFLAVMSVTASDLWSFIKIVLYLLLAWFLATLVGPLPLAVLGLTACYTTVKACFPAGRKGMTSFTKIGLKVISVAAFFCLITWVFVSRETKQSRTDADFILQWSNTYTGKRVLQQLINEKDTLQLRKILIETKDTYLAQEVADALAKTE